MARLSRTLLIALLPVLLAACASTPEQGEPAELTRFEQERELELLWSESVGNGQGDSLLQLVPAADGDILYVISADGELLALKAEKGEQVWRRELKEPVSGGIGIAEGLLLLGTAEGEVLALDKGTGELQWRRKLTGEILAAPQGNRDVVVAQTYDGHVVGLRADNGEQLWSYAASVPRLTLRGTSTPLLEGNLVLAGLANGRVVALDQQTGALHWEVRVSVPKGSTEIERLADVDGRLLVDNDQLFAVGYQGKIVAVDLRSGRRLWERDASSYVGLVAGYGNVYGVATDATITAYQQNGQGVIWSQTVLANRKLTEPAILGGSLVVGDFEGYLHFISQVDGHLVAREYVDSSGFRGPLLVDGNRLFAYANDGTLAVYRFVSGERKRESSGGSARKGPRR